jgi:hypothetical protein
VVNQPPSLSHKRGRHRLLRHSAPAIIAALHETKIAMEAEHLNSISNQLDDLAQRAAELRRYL